MKLLPKKADIDKSEAQERKRLIDDGLNLAKKVDALREARLTEEKSLFEWRDNTMKVVRKEIDDYITVRDNLKVQTEEAEVYRKKLLEPLDDAWIEVNTEKEIILEEKKNISLSKEALKVQTHKIKEEMEKVSALVSKIKLKENEIEKSKQKITALKEMAQREYEIAHEERITQKENHEKEISKVFEKQKEYENGIKIYEAYKKQVEEKESDLIIRENHLATQQKALQIAMEEIKKYGSNIYTNK